METIAGNLPVGDEENDSRHDIQNGWWYLDCQRLYATWRPDRVYPYGVDDKREYETIAGLLMEHLQRVPEGREYYQWLYFPTTGSQ